MSIQDKAREILDDDETNWYCVSCWMKEAEITSDEDRAALLTLVESLERDRYAVQKSGVCDVRGTDCETPDGTKGTGRALVIKARSKAG